MQKRSLSKKGLALPLEVIVVSIIMLFTLVVILALITGWFSKIADRVRGFPTLEIDPTADEPISFIPSVIYRGVDNKMTIGFYNTEMEDIPNTVIPQITCGRISAVTVKAIGLEIPVGKWKRYSALVSVLDDTEPGYYSCLMQVSQTDKTFIMEVR